MKNLARLLLAAALSWAASALPAVAQSSPGWTYGFVPTPAQWNAAFAAKQDVFPGPVVVTNVSNVFTADQIFSSNTNLTVPSGSGYLTSGAVQITGTGGLTVGGWAQMLGGALYIGTGTNATGVPTLAFPAGSGTVIVNLNGAGAGAVGGCGGAAIDIDNNTIQTGTLGNIGAVTNCQNFVTSYTSAMAWKANEGVWYFLSGEPVLNGSSNSIIELLHFSQGLRVNLNATLLPANLTARITGASLQLTQTDATVNRVQMDSYGAANFVSGSRANNTKASPQALVVDNEIIGINAYGFGTSAQQGPAGHVGIFAAGTWTGSSTATYVDLCSTPAGSTTCDNHLRYDAFGNVVVGTATPASGVTNGIALTSASAGGSGAGNYITSNVGFGGSLAWGIGGYSAFHAVSIDSNMLLRAGSGLGIRFETNGTTLAGLVNSSQQWQVGGSITTTLPGAATLLTVWKNSGTTLPTGFAVPAVAVVADDAGTANVGQFTFNTALGQPGTTFYKARGTMASPASVQSGDAIGSLFGIAYTTSGTPGYVLPAGAGLIFKATDNCTSTVCGSSVDVFATPAGSATLAQVASFRAGLFVGSGAITDPGAGAVLATDLYSNNATFLVRTKTTLTNSAAANTATLTNAPTAGNPTKWIAIDDNGTSRKVPAW